MQNASVGRVSSIDSTITQARLPSGISRSFRTCRMRLRSRRLMSLLAHATWMSGSTCSTHAVSESKPSRTSRSAMSRLGSFSVSMTCEMCRFGASFGESCDGRGDSCDGLGVSPDGRGESCDGSGELPDGRSPRITSSNDEMRGFARGDGVSLDGTCDALDGVDAADSFGEGLGRIRRFVRRSSVRSVVRTQGYSPCSVTYGGAHLNGEACSRRRPRPMGQSFNLCAISHRAVRRQSAARRSAESRHRRRAPHSRGWPE